MSVVSETKRTQPNMAARAWMLHKERKTATKTKRTQPNMFARAARDRMLTKIVEANNIGWQKPAKQPAKKHTVGTCAPALPKKCKHTSAGQKEFCEEEDPVFIPVYTGFDGDWKVVSWNRATKKSKRKNCTKYREHVLELQEHKCNYCHCSVSFGE